MEASLILTYRCNGKCRMCYTWKYPSKKGDEIEPKEFIKLPQLSFANITGGEPFLRDDFEDIMSIVKKKSRRIVISTNGFLRDRITDYAKKNKDVGIRVSLDGIGKTHDYMRGVPGAFEIVMRTMIDLKYIGVKDLGFGITISDENVHDLIPVFRLSHYLGVQLAICITHNSFYFHKLDNKVINVETVANEYEKLIYEYFKTPILKNWFRAYIAYGMIRRVYGVGRPFLCKMGTDAFFLDPYGEVYPCNVMKFSMGNLKKSNFDVLWKSKKADEVRNKVKNCKEDCWMVGSITPVMRKKIWIPAWWVFKHKFFRKKVCIIH